MCEVHHVLLLQRRALGELVPARTNGYALCGMTLPDRLKPMLATFTSLALLHPLTASAASDASYSKHVSSIDRRLFFILNFS